MWATELTHSQLVSNVGSEAGGLHLLSRDAVLQQACQSTSMLGSGEFSAVWAVEVNGVTFAMKVRSISAVMVHVHNPCSQAYQCAAHCTQPALVVRATHLGKCNKLRHVWPGASYRVQCAVLRR